MRALIGLATLAMMAACTEAEMPDAGEGAAVYAANCAACHGASGRGDGALAGDLSVKPADLTLLARGNGGRLPAARVLSYIDGYARTGREDVEMPEFGPLLEGPSVPVDAGDGVLTPTPRPLAALLAYLERIQR